MTLVWAALVVLAVVVIALAMVVVALAREVGLLSERLPPAPALDSQQGPAVGDFPPLVEAVTLAGRSLALTGPGSDARLLLFVSTRCAPCQRLIADTAGVRRDWPTQHLIVVASGSRAEVRDLEPKLAGVDVVWDEQGRVARHLNIAGTPFGVLLDPTGEVTARGVANDREMVSSLLDGRVKTVPADAWVELPGEAGAT